MLLKYIDEELWLKIAILLTLCSLLISWYALQGVIPQFVILDKVPNIHAEEIKYLGDKNMLFRANSVGLQNAGDTFDKITGLREYDYELVYNWLKFLETSDAKSQFTPALAGYYFGVTDQKQDLPYIMQFLEENYYTDPERKWWWLYLAIHIAKYKLEDLDKALSLAYILSSNPNPRIPKWARQMPAFILEQKGELEEALAVIKDIADNYNDFSQYEIEFMNYFIKNRLGFVEEQIRKRSLQGR